MDYFSFYGLPVSFNPDMKLVKLKFYELSRKYHPDFFINEPQEKQDGVLELSTLNNKAYQVLGDPQRTLHYVLELKGLLVEDYSLPQDFLMEMMEVNEKLMDLQFEPDADQLASVKAEVNLMADSMQEELDRLVSLFDGQNEEAQDAVLASVKDLYYRKKYLHRINDSLFKLESGL